MYIVHFWLASHKNSLAVCISCYTIGLQASTIVCLWGLSLKVSEFLLFTFPPIFLILENWPSLSLKVIMICSFFSARVPKNTFRGVQHSRLPSQCIGSCHINFDSQSLISPRTSSHIVHQYQSCSCRMFPLNFDADIDIWYFVSVEMDSIRWRCSDVDGVKWFQSRHRQIGGLWLLTKVTRRVRMENKQKI